MSDILRAADSVRSLAKLYRHMIDVADTLDQVGSYDQAVNERKQQLADYDAKVIEAKQALAEAKAELAKTSTEADEITKIAEENADEINDAAMAKAETVKKDNEKLIAVHIEKAKLQASTIIKRAQQNVDELDALSEKRKTELVTLNAELSSKGEALLALDEKIESTKSALRKMLGN